jgi:acetoacetyl-CoA synthetase
LSLETYEQLYAWSVAHIDAFWGLVWDETDVVGHKGTHVVDSDARPSDNPTWFKEARMNWAQNMLRERSPNKVALVETSESDLPGYL